MIAATAPSNLQVAAPFLITAMLTLLGGLGALLVVDRMETAYQTVLNTANVPAEFMTTELHAESLANATNWAIDGATIITSLLGPGIGLVLLYDDLDIMTTAIYSAVMFVAFGGFFLFVARVPVSGYPNAPFGVPVGRWRIRPPAIGPFTPIVVLAAGVNIFAGIWVLATGP
jgi:hypothetical protein